MIEHELNARPLGNKEVGNKFVLHPEFMELVRIKNSIIVGPRGSGKTTMLKMLTPEALFHWEPGTPEEVAIKESINFIGFYIPMSRIFQDDLEYRYKESKLQEFQKINLLYKIYFLNIVEAIIDFVHFYCQKVGFKKEEIILISQKFNSQLDLKIDYCYKLSSLLTKLSSEKLNCRRQIRGGIYDEEIEYFGEIISNIEPILNLVNEIFDFKPSQKYAICLDELDVYVSNFTTEMIQNLRGISTNILLKLTLAPIHSIRINQIVDPPSQTHDFDRIYLWPSPEITNRSRYNEENRYLIFTEKLAIQTFNELIGENVDIDVLLGKYSYGKVLELLKQTERKNNELKKFNFQDYNDSELEAFIFESYAKQDDTFRTFIERKSNKKLIELKTFSRKIKSETIRKLKPIVFNRLVCTEIVKNKRVFRRQRVQYQYHGKKLILKAIDGNPRYLKKLIEYLSEYTSVINGITQPVSISNQARSLIKVKKLFIQRINSIPLDGQDSNFAVGKLIKEIGNYLSNDLNTRSNWSTSFYSHINIPNIREIKFYEDTFKKAINNGALLIIDDFDLEKLNTVKLKSLRLNYLLHIEFSLPIRKFYPTSFENVIKIVPSYKTLFNND